MVANLSKFKLFAVVFGFVFLLSSSLFLAHGHLEGKESKEEKSACSLCQFTSSYSKLLAETPKLHVSPQALQTSLKIPSVAFISIKVALSTLIRGPPQA